MAQSLITFKSRAAADVTMLSDHAQSLLSIIGRSLGERGVITADQIPAAIQSLRAAIGQDDTKPVEDEEDERDESGAKAPAVRLSQRAWPLIDMLERAGREKADVLWGV
ncbi:DUF1840 domain-containing protein [soil metagenome]